MSHPFFNFSADDEEFFKKARANTALGRSGLEQENIQSNIEKLRSIQPVDDKQRKRIEMLVKSLETQAAGGKERPKQVYTDPRGEEQQLASSDFERGVAQGAAETVPQAVHTVAKFIPGSTAKRVRQGMEEEVASQREFYNPRGETGQVGEVAGSLAAAIPTYGPIAGQIARLVGFGGRWTVPALAAKVATLVDAGGISAHTASAILNSISGIPLNLAMAIDAGEDNPDAFKRQMTIGMGADFLFGAIHGKVGGTPPKTGARPMPTLDEKAAVELPVVPDLSERVAKIQAKKAQLEANAEARTQAKAEWQVANKGKKWLELSKEDRDAVVNAYKTRNAGTPPEEPPTAPAALPPAPPPGPSGGEAVAQGGTALGGKIGGKAPPTVEGSPWGTISDWWKNLSPEAKKSIADNVGVKWTDATGKIPFDDLPRFVKEKLAPFEGRIPIVDAPKPAPKPIAPLDKALADLKAKMSQTPPVEPPKPEAKKGFYSYKDHLRGKEMGLDIHPTNLTMTVEELSQKFDPWKFEGEERKAQIENYAKRLGAMQRFVDEGGNVEGVNPAALRALIDQQIKQLKSTISWHGMTPAEITGFMNDPNILTPDELVAKTDLDRSTKQLEQTATAKMFTQLTDKESKYNDPTETIEKLAKLTGETQEQVKARILDLVKAEYKEKLARYKEYAEDKEDPKRAAMWQKQYQNLLDNPIVPDVTDKVMKGIEKLQNPTGLPEGPDVMWKTFTDSERKEILRKAGMDEALHRIKDWDMISEETQDKIIKAMGGHGLPPLKLDDFFNEPTREQLDAEYADIDARQKFEDWWDRTLVRNIDLYRQVLDEHPNMEHIVNINFNDLAGQELKAAKLIYDKYKNHPSSIPRDPTGQRIDKAQSDITKPPATDSADREWANWYNNLDNADRQALWSLNKDIEPDELAWLAEKEKDWHHFPREDRDFLKKAAHGDIEPGNLDSDSYESLLGSKGLGEEKPKADQFNDPVIWWDKSKKADRLEILNRINKEKNLGLTNDQIEEMAKRYLFEDMAKPLRKYVREALEIDNLGVGKTVYEPSAAERAARASLPDDMRGPLMDLIIDLETKNTPYEGILQQIDQFGAEHELSPEQVQQGLKDLGYHPDAHRTPSATPEPDPTLPPRVVTEPSPEEIPPGATGAEVGGGVLRDMSLDEIDALKEKLFKRMEAGDESVIPQLNALAKETLRKQQAQIVADELQTKDRMELAKRANVPREAARPPMDPKEISALARKSPRKLTDDELDRLIDEAASRISGLDEKTMLANDWPKLYDKLIAERAARRPPPPQANLPPAAMGAAIGFTYGLFSSDDEHRSTNALMWALIGGVGAYGLNKILEGRKSVAKQSPEMYPGQHTQPQIVSYIDERTPNMPTWMTRMRRQYAGLVRGTAVMENAVKDAGGKNLPVWQSFVKRSEIFGRWIGKAEYALTYGPVIEVNGQPISLGAKPPVEIQKMASGDIANLDELSIARTVIEQMQSRPTASYPMDLTRAMMTYNAASPELHAAADALRELSLAGAKIAANDGLIAADAPAKFATETFYASLARVFGSGVTRQDLRRVITSPQPIKGRLEGSAAQVKSPFESAIEMLPKIIRAAEYNKIKQQFIAFAKTLPKELEEAWFKRVQSIENPQVEFYKDQVNALQATMPALTAADAHNLSISFSEEVTKANPRMSVYENGVLRTYRVNEDAFAMFKSLLPEEHNAFVSFLGGANRLAAKGIVHLPWFIGMQSAFIEPFQAALQSSYGFVPFIDNVKGWWSIVSGSPEYKKILSVGGVGSIQSLPYATGRGAIKAVEAGGVSPLEKALGHIKQLEPFQAWRSITTPFAEAARMGEALRALNHGESTLEAAYAAWHLLGNTRMEGSFSGMRAFNLMTLFSRPAISAIDEMVAKTGLHPFREPRTSKSTFSKSLKSLGIDNDRVVSGAEFAMKGFTYLTLPAIYLWYMNKDDAEITQLRQTEAGQRYFFLRSPAVTGLPDEERPIYKVRKPHILGQMFAGTAESILDKINGMDPEGTERWVGGLVNDAAFNILPQIGVIPASLLANKVWGFGQQIVPTHQELMETQMSGENRASNPARIVASQLEPLANKLDPSGFWTGALRRAATPAGLDFIMNNVAGLLGQDVVKSVDVALRAREEGLPPSKDELPIVGKLYARYPSMNTRNVRDFYTHATQAEIVQNSLHEIIATKPETAAQYIERHQKEIALAPTYTQVRQQIGNYTRGLQELRVMVEHKQLNPAEFKKVEKTFLETIIELTGQVNQVSREVRQP